MPERKTFSRFLVLSVLSFKINIYKIYIYDLLLDLLLGSTVSVDNLKMINKIMDLLWIISCDHDWIRSRITWDQKWWLYTGGKIDQSCYWDN
ncbi:hypothetical protein AL539_20435 [Vibrio alginolyticus]|nr:hypothetical protein AL539_20435 [Vibrio alginolyticus]